MYDDGIGVTNFGCSGSGFGTAGIGVGGSTKPDQYTYIQKHKIYHYFT